MRSESAPRNAVVAVEEGEIRRLQRRSLRGMWNLALFLLLSLGMRAATPYLLAAALHLRPVLGPPPATSLVSAGLVIYAFSGVIMILSRMMAGTPSYSGAAHLGYLAAFYLFYGLGGTLPEHFAAVLCAGLTILVLEAIHIRTTSNEALRELSENVNRRRRLAAWRGEENG